MTEGLYIYEIVARTKQGEEVVDTCSPQEVNDLVGEYRMAFGPGIPVRKKKRVNKDYKGD